MRVEEKKKNREKIMKESPNDSLNQKLLSLERDWEALKQSANWRSRSRTRTQPRTPATIDNNPFRVLDNSPLQNNRRGYPRRLFDSSEDSDDDDGEEVEVKSRDVRGLPSIPGCCGHCLCSGSLSPSSVKEKKEISGVGSSGWKGGRWMFLMGWLAVALVVLALGLVSCNGGLRRIMVQDDHQQVFRCAT